LFIKIEEKYGEIDKEIKVIVSECFAHFITKYFTLVGYKAVSDIIGKKGRSGKITIGKYEDILKKIVDKIEDANLRKACFEGISEVLANADDKTSQYLYFIAMNFFYMQVLNLDPECQRIEKELLSQKTLFLDTNFLISLILEHEKDHDACVKIVQLTKKAKSTLVFTTRTKIEFLALLDNAKYEYTLAEKNMMPSKKYANIFIRDYLTCKQRKPGLDWDAYVARLKKIDSLMKNLYDIPEDATDYNYIYELENFDNVVSLVQKFSTKFRHQYALPKTYNTAKHDAFHILLMRDFQHKGEYDILGAQKYFLTYDKTLSFVDRELGLEDEFPSCMQSEVWAQWLLAILTAPNMSDHVTAKVFGRLISSNFFSIGSFLDPKEEVINRIITSIDTRGLDPKEIESILSHKLINNYIKRACEDIKKGKEPPDPSQVVTKVEGIVKSEKIIKLSDEISKKDRKIEIYKGEKKQRRVLKDNIKKYIINQLNNIMDGIIERWGDTTIIESIEKYKEEYKEIEEYSDDQEAIKQYNEMMARGERLLRKLELTKKRSYTQFYTSFVIPLIPTAIGLLFGIWQITKSNELAINLTVIGASIAIFIMFLLYGYMSEKWKKTIIIWAALASIDIYYFSFVGKPRIQENQVVISILAVAIYIVSVISLPFVYKKIHGEKI